MGLQCLLILYRAVNNAIGAEKDFLPRFRTGDRAFSLKNTALIGFNKAFI